ncbi:MAG: serine/threonine-protein kinase [Polyangiales bacterium]
MASATTKAEPRRIAGYVVGERLAVGGHSEVFAARSLADGRDVVLKVPWPELSRDPSFRSSLAHEAELAKTLAHPAIVDVLDTIEVDGAPALVLERVDGCTLAALLEALRARGEALSPGAAVGLATVLLDGLAHLHEAKDGGGRSLGAVHRDVTPRNVLVSRRGEVKLADLGIARSRLRAERTRTGLVRGTPRYLSPEQATGSDVDARTDVYGVGLLLFEMLSGAPYLEGDGELELLRRAEDPPPRSLDASFPVGLRTALERALARFPEERFPSARSFARALAPFAATDPSSELATSVGRLLPVPESVAQPTSDDASAAHGTGGPLGRRLVLVAGTLVAFALAAFAIGARPRTPTAPRPAAESARASVPVPRLEPAPPPTSPAPGPRTPEDEPTSRGTRSDPPLRSTPRATRAEPAPSAAPSAPSEPGPATRGTPEPTPSPAAAPPPPAPPPIDRATVERQLARANAALREARARGRDTTPLDPLATSALEAFAEGDYARASQKLDRLLAALASP